MLAADSTRGVYEWKIERERDSLRITVRTLAIRLTDLALTLVLS